ncbi:unnamed protein product [Lymnaea stagnalis]|uniref:Phosphatidylinositol-specific phospholipase C X domain-containing protein n=1 Tax=Lymnaea stagnalis TaxID=6523 RepID=A0AAV2I8Q0_LYMST
MTLKNCFNNNLNTEDWMSMSPNSWHKIPLTELAIPGTHDSGTFHLDRKGSISPDTNSPALKFVCSIPCIGAIVKVVIQRWSKCQSLDIYQQLQAGIRYFDLRIAKPTDSDDVYLVHCLYGKKMSEVIETIATFLKEHPHEVVILHLNHFYGMSVKNHQQLIADLLSGFGSKVCPRHDLRQTTLNLKKLWSNGQQVIIIYEDPAAICVKEMFSYGSIESPWPNTPEKKICKEFLNKQFSERHNGIFFVCQGILTPCASTVAKRLLSSLERWIKPWTPELQSWVENSPKSCVQPLNIVIADFIEDGQLIQTIINVNTTKVNTEGCAVEHQSQQQYH